MAKSKKITKEILLIVAIVLLVILIFNKKTDLLSTSSDSQGNGSSGGSGGGGSGGGVTPLPTADTCQQVAQLNGFSYYKSPIYTQLACSTYAFSDCANRGLAFNNGGFNINLKCCVWNCKQQTDDDGSEEPLCSDSDGGNFPFVAGIVDVPSLAVMYPDACTNEVFNRYLTEWYCENGVARSTTIDCWGTYGAICGNGACHKPACEQITNPTSQSSCDIGYPCQDTGEETYCKFVDGGLVGENRCVCTIEPDSINSCTRACGFDGFVEGYCYDGPITKNPCGDNTFSLEGSQYCPILADGVRTCCCR
jgi:hypothetical protein